MSNDKLLSNMDRAVLCMPLELAFAGDVAQSQYHDRVQALIRRIDAAEAEKQARCVDPMCACRGGPCAECPEGDREAEKQAGPVDWVRWHGGACPVPWGTEVHVRHRTGREYGPCRAGESYAESWGHNGWSSDIVAYRLAAPPSESDKEDAELTNAEIDAMVAGHFHGKRHPDSYTALRSTIRDAIRAARAKKDPQ